MSMGFVLFAVIAPLLLLMAIGQPIGLAMACVGLFGVYVILGPHMGPAIGMSMWHSSYSFALTAIPIFLFMGDLLQRLGINERLYAGLTPWVSKLPGGLLHTNIASCAVFAAMSGSSVATVAFVGRVSVQEMDKRKYNPGLIVGSIAGGGTLGILIPPSILMIMYGFLTNMSVGRLFMAGLIPGILTALMYMLYIMVRVVVDRKLAPVETVERVWSARLHSLVSIMPALMLIAIVLGSIYLGIATPTESAALGATGAVILGLVYKRLTLKIIWGSLVSALGVTCMVMLIIVAGTLVSLILADTRVPRQLVTWLVSLDLPSYVIFVGLVLFYFLLGCFFEGASMLILTISVVFPIVLAFNWDPIWFGIILVMLVEVSLETPPVGLNLYTMQAVAPQYSFGTIVKGVAPFFLLDLLAMVMVAIFPNLALWLPSMMYVS